MNLFSSRGQGVCLYSPLKWIWAVGSNRYWLNGYPWSFRSVEQYELYQNGIPNVLELTYMVGIIPLTLRSYEKDKGMAWCGCVNFQHTLTMGVSTYFYESFNSLSAGVSTHYWGSFNSELNPSDVCLLSHQLGFSSPPPFHSHHASKELLSGLGRDPACRPYVECYTILA